MSEVGGQAGRVAEVVQSAADGFIVRQTLCGQIVQAFLEMIAEFIRDSVTLRGRQTQETG